MNHDSRIDFRQAWQVAMRPASCTTDGVPPCKEDRAPRRSPVRAVLAMAGVLLVQSGCYVQSLHPLHSESTVIFDPGLVGTWDSVSDPGNPTVIEAMDEHSYKLTITDGDEEIAYEGHLVKLGDSLYLDMFPTEERQRSCGDDFVSLHLLTRCDRQDDELALALIDHAWLSEMVSGEEFGDIPHFRIDDRIVLSMDTEQLQQAVVEFASRDGAFEEAELHRRVK